MSTPAPQTPSTRVSLRNVTIDNVHVDSPWAKRGDPADKRKYGLTVIVPKSHPQVKELLAAAEAAGKAKWGTQYNTSKFPIQGIRDTDIPTEMKHRNKKGYGPNVLFFNASRKPKDGPPRVAHSSFTTIDATGKTVPLQLDMAEHASVYPYSGCMGSVVVDFWAFDGTGSGHPDRICCDLAVVVKVADGERLTPGAADAEEAMLGILNAPAEEV
jgi:hypothetical protein